MSIYNTEQKNQHKRPAFDYSDNLSSKEKAFFKKLKRRFDFQQNFMHIKLIYEFNIINKGRIS